MPANVEKMLVIAGRSSNGHGWAQKHGKKQA
jgi:hypothetical protein